MLVYVPATGVSAASAAPRAATSAQSAFQAAIKQIVKDGVPGAIGLMRNGSQATVTASGLADVATHTPMTPADRVRVGSLTRTFVATLVLQLEAEHVLRISDTIARWLPRLVPSGADITLQELLQHTSGLYDYTSDPGFQQAFAADPTRVWQPAELVRIAAAHPPLFPPGTSWGYTALLSGKLLPAAQLREMMTTTPIGNGNGYGLGFASVHLPCGTAWGHQGDVPGYFSNGFITADGSTETVVLINADRELSDVQQNDIGNAVVAGICGSG